MVVPFLQMFQRKADDGSPVRACFVGGDAGNLLKCFGVVDLCRVDYSVYHFHFFCWSRFGYSVFGKCVYAFPHPVRLFELQFCVF